MLSRLARLGAGVLAALASACDGPSTMTMQVHPSGSWDFMVYAAKDGPVLAEVRNNPFALPDQVVEEVVLGVMGSAITDYKTLAFTTDPRRAAHPEFRVVVLFNASSSADAKALCGGKTPGTTPPGGDDLLILAAFCSGVEVLSEVRGRVGKTDTPDDKRFRRLLFQVARSLFVTRST